MSLSRRTRRAYNGVIKVDDYKLVATLRLLGFDMPHRHVAYSSEEIAEWAIDRVIEDSTYLYPNTKEIREALEMIKSNGIDFNPRAWNGALDELKMWFGVGSSKIENFGPRELNRTPGKKPVRVYRVGR
jgi:opacity protein-like surface antigen